MIALLEKGRGGQGGEPAGWLNHSYLARQDGGGEGGRQGRRDATVADGEEAYRARRLARCRLDLNWVSGLVTRMEGFLGGVRPAY